MFCCLDLTNSLLATYAHEIWEFWSIVSKIATSEFGFCFR